MEYNAWTGVRDYWKWLTERGSSFEAADVTASTEAALPKDMKALQPYASISNGMSRVICAYEDEVDEQKAFNAVASCLPEDRRPPKVVTRDGGAAWFHLPPHVDGDPMRNRGYICAQWEEPA